MQKVQLTNSVGTLGTKTNKAQDEGTIIVTEGPVVWVLCALRVTVSRQHIDY